MRLENMKKPSGFSQGPLKDLLRQTSFTMPLGLLQAFGGRPAKYSEYYQMALEDANICVRMDSTSPQGFALRAAVWQRQGYLFSAKEALEKLLELDENDSYAKPNLQEIREQIRRQWKAHGHSGQSLEKMVTKEPILERIRSYVEMVPLSLTTKS